jgi:hypothetical protein
MAKELAANSQHMAQAGLAKAKADEMTRRAKFQTPEFGTRLGSALAGLNDNQAGQVEGFQKAGFWGQLPAGVDGPPDTRTPDFATPETMGKVSLGRAAHLASLGATGDTDGGKIVKSFLELMGRRDFEGAMANPGTIPTYGAASAASEGKPLYHQGANGTMQLFNGAENINEVGRSAARENIAQAGAANAKAALDRSKIGQPQFVVGPDGSPVAIQPQNLGKPPAGYRWKQDGSLEPIPGGPVDTKLNPPQRIQDAKDVLSLLDMAGPILDQATGSYMGTGADMAARVIGKSTEGGEAAAQLKALEGALVSKMPKMSGPQSDKDVLLYRQMAGQIGDSTIPAKQKKAAMAAIRTLNERYAGQQPKLQRGQVMEGYRFKGGNPAEPSSWEPVK